MRSAHGSAAMPADWPPARLARSSTGTWRVWVDLPDGTSLEVSLPYNVQRALEAATFPDTLTLWDRVPHAV